MNFSLGLSILKWHYQWVNIYWMPDMWTKPYEMQKRFLSLSFLSFSQSSRYIFSLIRILTFPIVESFPFIYFHKKIWKLSFIGDSWGLSFIGDSCHFRSRNNLRSSRKYRGFASGHKTFLLWHILFGWQCSRFPMVNILV